jgi:hypothetical protein
MPAIITSKSSLSSNEVRMHQPKNLIGMLASASEDLGEGVAAGDGAVFGEAMGAAAGEVRGDAVGEVVGDAAGKPVSETGGVEIGLGVGEGEGVGVGVGHSQSA